MARLMTRGPQSDDARGAALLEWLGALEEDFALVPQSLRAASSDASFRRYFRIDTAASPGSLIIMDAPPELEDSAAFVAVAALFARAEVSVPAILAADLDKGFLLLTDLGQTTYLDRLDATQANRLYSDAQGALIRIQQLSASAALPPYSRAVLEREMRLFPEWYVERYRGHRLTESERVVLEVAFGHLAERALSQPMVPVHRDFHSRNLMLLDPGSALSNPGILDFQDALMGPITYDLASLLRDAYIAWDEEQVLDWAIRYWEAARRAGLPVHSDFGEFWKDFEWMGLQRHLKILGIFARLHLRDGKDNYLSDLPLVLHYVRAAGARYREFFPLLRLLDQLEGGPGKVGLTF